MVWSLSFFFFFFNDTATTEIYTLSLHDALPILKKYCWNQRGPGAVCATSSRVREDWALSTRIVPAARVRSEEHTSELQSRLHLVCRLLLEKKKKKKKT